MIETEKFRVHRIEFETLQSREINASRMPSLQRGAARLLEVECKACGGEWSAIEGRGMTRAIGCLQLECPSCGAEDGIASSVLLHAP
jgi:hypothetical protein